MKRRDDVQVRLVDEEERCDGDDDDDMLFV
jgi:hypothetical protein